MILETMVLHNFGVFAGRQCVDLRPRKNKPIVLIGGLNGGGKTTFLDALQLVLYGPRAHLSNRGSLAYDRYLRRCLHRHADPDEGLGLELRFRHVVEGKERTYQVSRYWRLLGSGTKEHLEIVVDDRPDSNLAREWPDFIEQLLPAGVSHLFFFDGEKIEALAEPESSAKTLETAIHALLGLNLVEKLVTDLSVLERRKRMACKAEPEQRELEALEREVAAAQEQYLILFKQRASQQTALDVARREFEKISERYRKAGGELAEQRQGLEQQHKIAEERVRAADDALRELAQGAAPLLLVSSLLEGTRQQARRESRAQQARVLAEVLEQRDAGLLEAVAPSNPGDAILQRIEGFLRQDRKRRLELAQVECYLDLSSDGARALERLSHVLADVREELLRLLDRRQKAQEELDACDRSLAAIPDDDAVAQLATDRSEARLAVAVAEEALRRTEEELEQVKKERDHKRTQLARRLEKAVEEDFARESDQRILEHSARARRTLAAFGKALVARNVAHLESLVLESFRALLRKDRLVRSVHIDPETFSVELVGSNGEHLPAARLSAGERQLLAVSLLWGLARASGRPLPAVVDTPLGRLDSKHRSRLVERYFPYASHQVLLLSTDEEIDRRYYEKLKAWVARSYTLQHDDRLGATTIRPGYFWQQEATRP